MLTRLYAFGNDPNYIIASNMPEASRNLGGIEIEYVAWPGVKARHS